MLGIGENVVYGGNIMTVVDIREETVLGKSREYYVLRTEGEGDSSLTFVPSDNEALVKGMAPIITEEGIRDILTSLRGEVPRRLHDDSRVRNNIFKKILEDGERAEIIRMIRDIKAEIAHRAESGKRGYLTDENILRRAERRIYSEFSLVLGISQSDVADYIEREIG